ncbi:MAG: ABC transporter substrate-binding protein [Nitrococcus sp.]|nr:ABC transporter substrate-binding protein [Nitrococcus sp.]
MLRRIFATPVAGNAVVVGAVLLWLILAQAAAQSTAQQSPVEVVAQLQQKLVAVWRSDTSFQRRFESLAPVITASHDFATMTRFALGNRWQELNPAQREQFVAIFRRLSIATYADRFDDYDGERFVQSGQRSLSEDQHLVQTQLWLSDGTQIRLDYLLHQQGGQWTIINVLAEGVSELAIKRSEYTAFIRDHGFTALVQELQRKISDMASEQRATPAPSD